MFDKTLNDKGNICLIKMNVKTMWLLVFFIKRCFDDFFSLVQSILDKIYFIRVQK